MKPVAFLASDGPTSRSHAQRGGSWGQTWGPGRKQWLLQVLKGSTNRDTARPEQFGSAGVFERSRSVFDARAGSGSTLLAPGTDVTFINMYP